MPVALPALELVAWLTFAVVLILASTIKFWLRPIFGVINATIGHIPYVGGRIHGGETAVLSALNGVIATSRHAMTTLLQGVKWSMNELITGVRDFADDVADKWDQLVQHAIPGALDNLYAKLHGEVSSVSNRLSNLAGTVTGLLQAAEDYADRAVSHAVSTVERYADQAVSDLQSWTTSHVHGVYQEVEADIADAAGAMTRYVNAVVGELRSAEDAAVAAASAAAAGALEAARRELAGQVANVAGALAGLEATLEGQIGGLRSDAAAALSSAAGELRAAIAAGVADAEQLAGSALATAEQTLEAELGDAASAAAAGLQATATALQGAIGQVAQAEQATVAELSAAEQAAAGELADVYNLPTEQIRALLDRLDLTKVLGFGAGLVLVRQLVEAIASEAGLDDAACRAKHKQICGVDPSEWTDLLAGAAFLTGELSLAVLVPIGRQAIADLGGLIAAAA